MKPQQQLNFLLKKIIRSGVGRARYVMAAVGLSIAMLLILAAVQVQVDYNELLYGKNNRDSIANFLVVNKIINGNSRDNTLSAQDISDLKRQPFTDGVGVLTSSRFKVSAQSPSANFPFYTDLFFESVPDEFIDVKSDSWKWEAGSTTIPLIIPNQFLDLYNFGFAPSQGLPQLTQGLVMSLPVVINVSYNGLPVRFTGRVAGFSDRISSVLVPDNFLQMANKQFGQQSPARSSRIIIRTKDPGNPQLVEYLKAHNLSTDADKTRFSKYRQVVNVVVNASWVTGLTMLLFALLVFSLFIQLTIASTRHEINLLITIGAAPGQLRRFLMKQFLPLNVIIVIASLLAIAAGQYALSIFLQSRNMFVSLWVSYYTIGAAILILLVLFVVNYFTIKKYVSN